MIGEAGRLGLWAPTRIAEPHDTLERGRRDSHPRESRRWYDAGFCGSSSIILSMVEVPLMDWQILRAKLYVPRYRANAVPRSRLHERLDEGAKHELTVVSAPAGFGKTTLLADWSQRSELPVAWVSLDERDDPRGLRDDYACLPGLPAVSGGARARPHRFKQRDARVAA